MGEKRATFAGGFDLPLLALSEDIDLQNALCGRPLMPVANGNLGGSGVEFRTRWDGVVFPIRQ